MIECFGDFFNRTTMTPPDDLLRPVALPEAQQLQGSPDTLRLDTLPPVAQLRVTTCARVGEILMAGEKRSVCDETAKEINNISEENRKDFLKTVYRSLGTESQDIVLKQAIEKNTVQMYEVL